MCAVDVSASTVSTETSDDGPSNCTRMIAMLSSLEIELPAYSLNGLVTESTPSTLFDRSRKFFDRALELCDGCPFRCHDDGRCTRTRDGGKHCLESIESGLRLRAGNRERLLSLPAERDARLRASRPRSRSRRR